MANKRLVRRRNGKMIAGVCTGLADYFGLELSKVRLAFVFFGLFGPGEVAYIVLWILAPKDWV
jgi:phage shock protein PspC (stress-responsive transcriptional regulator)